MIVKTESDGETTDVYVTSKDGKYGVRLTVINNESGTRAYYENSNGEEYELLHVTPIGRVINEEPLKL